MTEDYLKYIIIKVVRGLASEEEKRELEHWMNQRPAYKERLEELMKDESLFIDDLKKMEDFNLRNGRLNFHRQVQLNSYKKIRRLFHFAAAVLILACGLSYFTLEPLFQSKSKLPGDITHVSIEQEGVYYPKPIEGAVAVIEEEGKEELVITRDSVRNASELLALLTHLGKGKVDVSEEKPRLITIKVPHKSKFHFTLSDGSQLWLNANSTVKLYQPFAQNERRIDVEGEAYVDVVRDSLRPFFVHLPNDSRVEVLGTRFVVQGYQDASVQELTLLHGKVKWHSSGNKSLAVKSGEQLKYDVNSNTTQVETSTSFHHLAWLEDRFAFDRAKMIEVTQTFSRWYDVDFHFTSKELENIPFTINVKHYDNIEEILQKIELTEKVRFKYVEGHYKVVPYFPENN